MQRRALATAAAMLAMLPFHGSAQGAENGRFGRDMEFMVKDFVHVWTSPLHMDARDLIGAAVVGGSLAASLLTDRAVQDWISEHPRSLPVVMLTPFREASPLNYIGRSVFLVPAAAVAYLAGLAIDHEDLRDAGIGCLTSNAATSLSRMAIAAGLGRLRPRYYPSPWVFEPLAFGAWPMRSVFGGHGANIASCVAFWDYFFDIGAAAPALYVLSVLVGYARVIDEAHWQSDTSFGLLYGFAIGKAVAARFSDRANDDAADTLEPRVYVGWSVRF